MVLLRDDHRPTPTPGVYEPSAGLVDGDRVWTFVRFRACNQMHQPDLHPDSHRKEWPPTAGHLAHSSRDLGSDRQHSGKCEQSVSQYDVLPAAGIESNH